MANLVFEDSVEQCLVQISGKVNTLFPLTLSATEISNNQPWMLHERIRLGKHRCSTIRQAILSPSCAALLCDTIWVSQGKQAAHPHSVLCIRDWLRCRAAQE
ncbi:hypothetical protein D3C73_685920 [compost metagenome]